MLWVAGDAKPKQMTRLHKREFIFIAQHKGGSAQGLRGHSAFLRCRL